MHVRMDLNNGPSVKQCGTQAQFQLMTPPKVRSGFNMRMFVSDIIKYHKRPQSLNSVR